MISTETCARFLSFLKVVNFPTRTGFKPLKEFKFQRTGTQLLYGAFQVYWNFLVKGAVVICCQQLSHICEHLLHQRFPTLSFAQ